MSILEETDIDKIRKQLKVGKEPKKDNAKKRKNQLLPLLFVERLLELRLRNQKLKRI